MTTEEFAKASCELIELIQEYEIQALLAKSRLLELRERYIEESRNNEQA